MATKCDEQCESPKSLFSITVVPPDTSKNFTLFNKECEELDSEFLMQPVNEADYDSETQICVDTNTGGPRSFYDHFTTKRRKKKLRRGADGPSKHSVRVSAPDITKPPQEGTKDEKEEKEQPRPAAHQDPSLLMLPGTAVPKGALQNAAVRRIACGRMPPTPMPRGGDDSPKAAPGGSNFLNVGTTTFRKAPLPSERLASSMPGSRASEEATEEKAASDAPQQAKDASGSDVAVELAVPVPEEKDESKTKQSKKQPGTTKDNLSESPPQYSIVLEEAGSKKTMKEEKEAAE